MIHMGAFIPGNTQRQLKELLQWGKVRHEQLSHAILITKDSVLGYLKRQLQKGNFEAVLDVLEGKPMTSSGRALHHELQNHIADNLMLQLRIGKVLAVSMSIIILPLILAKLSDVVLDKFKEITEE
ncbi:hypothetical protein [Pontibacter burrus]|uniref:Uncharacterized protein n=1 Tax=Pontibacter burrus TaxID=2704466 RepID=A0A6B3LV35_9BACT|nr:hypothetical protein [Pontibacter burrus]NEM98845.1 hypothetical protein [Pontibacter burrus]